jgi:hypothetical protein
LDGRTFHELNVQTITGDANTLLIGISIRNVEATASPEPLARIGLEDGAADQDTIDAFSEKDAVYLRFPKDEQRTSVWVKDVNADVNVHCILEYDYKV